MKLLEEIPSFPAAARETLETHYGITSAEAFFDHAFRNPAGMRKALGLSNAQLTRVLRLTEGYLEPEFVARCKQPVVKRPRGVIVEDRPKRS